MEKVEFQMKPTKSDFSKAAWAKMKISRVVHIYLIVTGLLLAGCILWKNYGPESTQNFAEGLGFLSFLALLFPFIYFQRTAHDAFKRGVPRIEECLFTIDEKGFGWKSDPVSVRLSWSRARGIYETADFILVRLPRCPYFTIFKNQLSPEVVKAVRKIITDAPVKNKTMRPL